MRGGITIEEYFSLEEILYNKTKAMQKKETINSYCDGRLSVINKNVISAEQYYNSTFGGEDEQQ